MEFEMSERRFVLKFSDRRRVKVKTMKVILSMDESVQRDILALGVPMTNYCESIQNGNTKIEEKISSR
ncbi:hypothetical protein Hanom_Chr11g00998251 [Helianthus anomalus]